MKFSEIYGHERTKNILKRALQTNEVGHAYIFEGRSGIGRYSMAEAFASALLCQNPEECEPCEKCPSCVQCAAGSNPDVRVITNALYDPKKKSNKILTDTIRAMKQEIYIKPALGERRVYIIPNADTMNNSAQNSLLKILEEPPAYCTLILIAENSAAFLPTVLSRAVRIKFLPLSAELVYKYLEDKGIAFGDRAQLAAFMSEGSIGSAKEILQNDELFEIRNQTIEKLCGLLKPQYKNIFELSKFIKQNKDNKEIVFGTIKSFFGDLVKITNFGDAKAAACRDKQKELDAFCAKVDKRASVELLDILLEYMLMTEKNVNFSAAAGLMAADFWEVINDRDNRSQI